MEQRAESHTWCNQRKGRFLVCTGAPGSFMLTHWESDVNSFVPSYSGDPQPPTQSSPSPPWLHSKWTCLDLLGTRSDGQSGCPGVMAHVLGPERDGYGPASGTVDSKGQPRPHKNRGIQGEWVTEADARWVPGFTHIGSCFIPCHSDYCESPLVLGQFQPGALGEALIVDPPHVGGVLGLRSTC